MCPKQDSNLVPSALKASVLTITLRNQLLFQLQTTYVLVAWISCAGHVRSWADKTGKRESILKLCIKMPSCVVKASFQKADKGLLIYNSIFCQHVFISSIYAPKDTAHNNKEQIQLAC